MSNHLKGKVNTFDGVELFYTKDVVDSAKAVVVIVHVLYLNSFNFYVNIQGDMNILQKS